MGWADDISLETYNALMQPGVLRRDERQVLELKREGLTDIEVGAELNYDRSTIKRRCRSIRNKL